jgi:putative ABC transport system permease protein
LQNFFLRIQIGVGIPLAGIGVLLSLGLLTVLSQTYLAAQRNPVESLRD